MLGYSLPKFLTELDVVTAVLSMKSFLCIPIVGTSRSSLVTVKKIRSDTFYTDLVLKVEGEKLLKSRMKRKQERVRKERT